MPIDPGSIIVGRCYATPMEEVRKVLEIKGVILTYVARGKMAFPSWDRDMWRCTTIGVFAKEVDREVASDWHTP